jgi:plastocyanin
MLSAWRSVLLVGALCAVCGASVAIAFAAPTHARRHHPSSARKACHRKKHRHCPLAHSGKGHSGKGTKHKRKLSKNAKPAKPTANGQSTGGAAPAVSAPSVSGSNTSSGTSSGTEEAAPTKAPVSPAPSAPARVEVTAEDSGGFRFVLSRSSVPAGKTIIEFVNHGQDEHNLNAAEGGEGEVVGTLPNTPSRNHLSLTVNLKPGSYTLFCSLPGHAAKGMKATLTVE